MAVLARGKADGILLGGQLQLTISGAKEHEQLEDRQEILVSNSMRWEPSLPAIPCRVTGDVPEPWDLGSVTTPREATSAGSEWKRTSRGSTTLSKHITSYNYNPLNLTPWF